MLIQADARTIPLRDGCVQCVVTSPPYFGLRDYGSEDQIGLESSPDSYVVNIVRVFRELRRVLKDDGIVWLNLGDSYAGSNQTGGTNSLEQGKRRGRMFTHELSWQVRSGGLKQKDLMGIPWRVAFALQADGWYLRSDVIWSKPNPMPESVQGSHWERHKITVDEYERLSGLRYLDERAGDDWAGHMPSLSEEKTVSRKAPLSTESEGYRDHPRVRVSADRAREASSREPIIIRTAEQGEVRIHTQGPTNETASDSQVSRQRKGQSVRRGSASTDEGSSDTAGAAEAGQQKIQADGEGQGAVLSPVCQAEGRDVGDGAAVDGGGMARDRSGAQGPVPLLPTEAETDGGSCDPVEQGRPAHEDEHCASVPAVQFAQAGQVDRPVLVGCPGCPKCLDHHGWIFRLSAGRPTKAHEYLFLLSKSEKYFYDAAAIAEPVSAAMLQEMEQGYEGLGLKDYGAAGVQNPSSVKARIIANARRKNEQSVDRRKVGFNDRWDKIERYRAMNPALARGGEKDSGHGPGRGDGGAPCNNPNQLTRNRRTVWTIPTMPYVGAHFATMPEKLVEPCILAGSRFGDLVFDPFSGSGTVLAVAERLGRRAVGTDLNPAYHELAKQRTAQRGLRFGA